MTLQLSPTDTTVQPVDPDELNIHPLLSQRASSGSFSAVGLQWHQIIQLLQAARCAPSSYNSQPWHFVVVQDGPGRSAIDQDLIQWGALWAAKAPVLIVVIAELDSSTTLHGMNYALFDCGMAVQNILLQATSMGLAAHPVGFQNRAAVHRALNLQPEHTLLLFVAVGNPDEHAVNTNASRLRKPLPSLATWDRWSGSPVVEEGGD